jgi:hypothetical protein
MHRSVHCPRSQTTPTCVLGHLNTASGAPSQSKILIFRHSKMQCRYVLVVIYLTCVLASPLRRVTKSYFCTVLLNRPRMHSPTSHFSHFVWMGLLFPRASSRRNTVDDKSRRSTSGSSGAKAKQLSAARVRLRKEEGNKEFSFLNCSTLPCMTFSKKNSNIWRLYKTWKQRNEWFYCFQMFYGIIDCENMSRITSRKDIIMQDCSVKKRMSFLPQALKTVKN